MPLPLAGRVALVAGATRGAGRGIASNHWLLDTSILHHIRPAPAVPLDWASIGWLGLIAGTAAALAIVLFARRDIATPE